MSKESRSSLQELWDVEDRCSALAGSAIGTVRSSSAYSAHRRNLVSRSVTTRSSAPVTESSRTVSTEAVRRTREENADVVLLRAKVKDVLDTLTEQERRVLEQRFGLVGGYSRTLEEVGRQLRVSRERIRQIEAKVLGKIKREARQKVISAASI